jgi:hypothetical protein
MGSIWFKNRQNQTAPKKSFTSPNIAKYFFTFNNSKQSSTGEKNIPGSSSDSKLSNIKANNNVKTKTNKNELQNVDENATNENKSSSSSSSDEDKKEENELPKPNFEFPLLNQIYPNRNRRATVAQIDGY